MKGILKIEKAIAYYNSNKTKDAPKLTVEKLALIVFKDKKSKDICKVKLFSQIVNGHRRFIDPNWLISISEATGYPVKELIEYT